MTIDIGFNAGRICDAISKIGYEPYTAIMDLVDNSVTAEAGNIWISLDLKEGKSLKSRNSVKSYMIIDDGCGMDEEGVKNAFALGSNDKLYKDDSLSKYGLGLKSAGLSLGSKISIISKKNNKITKKYIFDSKKIKKENKFFIEDVELKPEMVTYFSELIKNDSGTVVLIEGCESVNQASPKSTIEKLKRRLGVTYFSFLSSDKPLNIAIRTLPYGKQEEFTPVKARDVLFMNSINFKENYHPDKYDYYSPYLALDEDWELTGIDGNKLPPIRIKAVVFPQATLASKKSPLELEKKKVIEEYEISKDNKGFFIYRNGRLIRWGDSLDGIISKDDYNLRIRMDLKSAHDDVLHVDVTKQRLEIDDENKQKLEIIVNKALATARSIRVDCQSYMKSDVTEGRAFTSTLDNVAEDDPEENNNDKIEYINRRNESALEGEKAKVELNESNEDDDDEFKKIIYSSKVKYGRVWQPFYDAKEGVFVGINKNHPFYEEFLSRFGEGSVERIVAEALVFSVGLAERNTIDNFTDTEADVLNRIFRKFHKNIDNWLSEWSSENYSLKDE
ncbi:ATP-binding protein [Pseudoalteromonas xiamenensis]